MLFWCLWIIMNICGWDTMFQVANIYFYFFFNTDVTYLYLIIFKPFVILNKMCATSSWRSPINIVTLWWYICLATCIRITGLGEYMTYLIVWHIIFGWNIKKIKSMNFKFYIFLFCSCMQVRKCLFHYIRLFTGVMGMNNSTTSVLGGRK